MALDNVRAHKFRSVLTVLGIVIGVGTVIAISSILTGMRSNLVSMIQSFGTRNIFAFHLTTGIQMGGRDRRERSRKPLTVEDGEAIKELCTAVEDVGIEAFIDWQFDRTLTYGNISYKRGNIQGVTSNYGHLTNQSLSEGHFITEIDDQHRRDVMVIGSSVAEALFPHQANIVGSEVTMAGRPYSIIGVLEKQKTSFMGETQTDNLILIPLERFEKCRLEAR